MVLSPTSKTPNQRSANGRSLPGLCGQDSGLGDLDRAFEWQDRTNADGAGCPFNSLSRVIDVMHADPRHAEDLRERGWRQ